VNRTTRTEVNPAETSEETAARIGIDPNGSISDAQLKEFFAAREQVKEAAAEFAAIQAAPPPPPPSPDDLLGLARQKAAQLREDREIANDLREVLLADNRETGLTEEELAGMSLAELRIAAGIDKSEAQLEEDLSNDYAANLAAADAEDPNQFGSEAWKQSIADDLAARDSKSFDDGDL
jgi:hypothetical protein